MRMFGASFGSRCGCARPFHRSPAAAAWRRCREGIGGNGRVSCASAAELNPTLRSSPAASCSPAPRSRWPGPPRRARADSWRWTRSSRPGRRPAAPQGRPKDHHVEERHIAQAVATRAGDCVGKSHAEDVRHPPGFERQDRLELEHRRIRTRRSVRQVVARGGEVADQRKRHRRRRGIGGAPRKLVGGVLRRCGRFFRCFSRVRRRQFGPRGGCLRHERHLEESDEGRQDGCGAGGSVCARGR